jgi:hypothetical protein
LPIKRDEEVSALPVSVYRGTVDGDDVEEPVIITVDKANTPLVDSITYRFSG